MASDHILLRQSLATPEAVVWAYRLILGREPESEQAVQEQLRANTNLLSLRQNFLSSSEFQQELPRESPRAEHEVIHAVEMPKPNAADVDFRELVRLHSFTEHARRADEYFSALDLTSAVARKPYATADEAVELSAGVGAVLAGLKLFSGARVLDFGAGTCWFSRLLALLGCEVVAADVSGKALELGRTLIEKDPLASSMHVEYSRLETGMLPFPDESFDRVLCFDALHHVPDQALAIAEFARVLRTPGIAVLHEPGPDHSRSPQSQYEMRKYGVIEADVHIEKLIEVATEHGFDDAQLAVYGAHPLTIDLSAFEAFLAGTQHSATAARQLIPRIRDESRARRVCFLHKGDPDSAVDSRRREGLRMEYELLAARAGDGIRVSGWIRNIGSATWLSSSSDEHSASPGDVNIGIHLEDHSGTHSEPDYARRSLSLAPVRPGEMVLVDFTLAVPTHVQAFNFVVDLVAEYVTWFEFCGGKPFRIEI